MLCLSDCLNDKTELTLPKKKKMIAFIRKLMGKRKEVMNREMYRLLRINRKLSISKKVRF